MARVLSVAEAEPRERQFCRERKRECLCLAPVLVHITVYHKLKSVAKNLYVWYFNMIGACWLKISESRSTMVEIHQVATMNHDRCNLWEYMIRISSCIPSMRLYMRSSQNGLDYMKVNSCPIPIHLSRKIGTSSFSSQSILLFISRQTYVAVSQVALGIGQDLRNPLVLWTLANNFMPSK